MNVRRELPVSALSASAKIPGEVMSAPAMEIFYTSESMILA